MTETVPTIRPDDRFSVIQAAAVLSVSRNTIYRAVRNGRLPTAVRKATGKPYILGKHLLAYWRS